MNISEHLTKKKLLWLAGTLLIGALGSGLWEAIVKPGMLWFGTLMLDLGTLGLSSLRDGMYADIAKGPHERASVLLLSMATGAFAGFLFARASIVWSRRRQKQDKQPSSTAARILDSDWAVMAIPIAIALMFFVTLFRVSYIVRATNYADQLIEITSPYVSDKERLLLRSEFAQIKTRGEYVLVVEKLRKIATENKASAPEFLIY